MRFRICYIFFISILGMVITANTIAQSNTWPNYRGPDSNGISQAKNIPTEWDSITNIAWRIPIEGKGWSSPVIMDGQVWVTTATPEGTEFRAVCIGLESGKIIHNIIVFKEDTPLEIHPLNSYASPAPVVEHGRAYMHFGTYGTACIDTGSGKILWSRRDINCDHEVGPGSSPAIYNDLLILTMDGTDVQYLQALNKKTGKTVWKKYRGLDFSQLNFDQKKAFTTPVFKMVNGQELMFSAGPHAVMAYEPETGNQAWMVEYEGFSASAQPVMNDEMIFVNTGFGKSSLVGIKFGGTGNQTDNAVKWINVRNTQARSSPLLIDGLLYMINTGGQAMCLDPETGETIWMERIGAQTSASPVYVEGKIYSFDQEGLCTIFKPGRNFRKIAENQLPEGIMASPAVIDGALVVRTKEALYRISTK
jgi:outer membrane protein assembly factor BamB